MEHYLYKLNFRTALHIGRDGGGASLDDGQMTIHADTLVAALCCEAVRSHHLDQLVSYLADGTLTISDALPYAGEELYLPKPILFVKNQNREGDAATKKALKGVEYIPLSYFQEYLQGLSQPQIDIENLRRDFGQLTVSTRVAIKGQNPLLPYHVAAWKFKPSCGLYLVVRTQHDSAQSLLESLLSSLGLSGIGGKQSSGWGKFRVHSSPVPEQLQHMLADQQASYHMLLGTALPVDQELEDTLKDGWYALVRRGGFIRSNTYAPGQFKKRTIYMLAPGSCLRRRFKGGLFDLSDNGAHPIWRCGNTLFAGVNI